MKTWKRALALVLALVMALSLVALPSFAEGEEKDTYSVVINYVFADGSQAAPSWTATLANGSAYHNTVTSPTVVGYTPDKGSVELNFAAIHKDETYKVTYYPALVDVTVRHYWQNAEGENYTLHETENRQMPTGSDVGAGLAKTYPGFTALLYETTTKVAADGSTVVEIKYDRNYYLLNLNLDGGWGVEPIYARYGAPVSLGTPEKAGYTFNGWNPEFALTTMPAQDTTYTAQWKAPDTANVTVVIWGENANDEGYSYYDSIITSGKPGETYNPLTCGKEAHTHSDACGIVCGHTHGLTFYGLSANARSVTPSSEALKYFAQLSGGIQDGYIYFFDDNGRNGKGDIYYLRLNGNYYQYTETPNSNMGTQVGSRVSCDEGIAHATDYFYKYNVKITCGHHTDSCYSCGKTAHTHTPACFPSYTKMDSTLWTLVRSDTATVSADGTTVVNVYYDRAEKTLHFREANSSSDTYGTITAKWGADIDAQYKAILKKTNNNSFWSRHADASEPFTNYIGVMPTEDRTYYLDGDGGGKEGTMSYYFQDLNGNYPNTPGFTVDNVGGYSVSDEDHYDFEGFTYNHGTANKVSCVNAKFYYTRNSYNLAFNDGTGVVKEATVKYEDSLGKYDYKPDVPADLYEKDSRVFAGWYLNPECTGEEYKLNEHTMPANNVLLYAKWAPVEHKVTYSQTEGGNPLGQVDNVPHGDLIKKVPDVEYGERTFVGWFYKDENGVEHAFHPSMPVRRNMDLYAKWRTDVAMSYTIRYAIQNENGELTYIAEDTTGSALAESTKTFEAKTGADLYADYQTGYFPQVSSHSMVISLDNPEQNEYTFIYVKMPAVNYTVRYLEKGTNTVLHEDKKDSTSAAVVTEKFVAINGYAPDAYQKRLVLSTDESQNVITFWYVRDEVHAPVQIIHWVQNIAGDGYTEYQSSTNLNGVIKKTYSADPIAITGFVYARGTVEAGASVTNFPAGQNPSGILTADGLVLNLYYDRIECPYEFRFVDKLTGREIDFKELGVNLDPVPSGSARYDATVSYAAPNLEQYGYQLDGEQTQTIRIQLEDGNTAVKNVKTFYYQPFFTVVHSHRTAASTAPDQTPVKVYMTSAHQDAQIGYSLTAQVESGFLYGGSFTDEACTKPWVYENGENPMKFIPDRGQKYYIWEVSQDYLHPFVYYVYRPNLGEASGYYVTDLYMMAPLDRTLYREAGFTLTAGNTVTDYTVQHKGESVAYGIVRVDKAGQFYQNVYVKNVNDSKTGKPTAKIQTTNIKDVQSENGCIAFQKVNPADFAYFKEKAISYNPYWITLDGVKVTSVDTKTCTYIAPGPGGDDVETKNTVTGSKLSYVGSQDTQAVMSFVPMLKVSDTAKDEITVTVHENGDVRTVDVQPGDLTGKLAYTEVAGKLFAGYFLDEACTVPADFSDVQEDITVYAKYVSDSYLQVKYTEKGLFRVNGVNLFSAVSSKNDFAEVGILVNGQPIDTRCASRYLIFRTARTMFGLSKSDQLVIGEYSLRNAESGAQLVVTPYWVTQDGTTVTGTQRTLTYTARGIRG